MSAAFAVAYLRHIAETGGEGDYARFDTLTLQGLYAIKADDGSCSCCLDITTRVCNRYDTLHGGCIATLVDVVGSAALYSVSDKGGVSLNINTTYLNPLALGQKAVISARVIKLGRSVATIDVDIKNAATEEVVAVGTHVKFISPSNPTLPELLSAEERHRLEQCCRGGGGTGGGRGSVDGGPGSRL